MADPTTEEQRKLLNLIESTPTDRVGLDELARQLGLTSEEAGRMIGELEDLGLIRWDGERPLVVRGSGKRSEAGTESYGGDQDADSATTVREISGDRPPAEGREDPS